MKATVRKPKTSNLRKTQRLAIVAIAGSLVLPLAAHAADVTPPVADSDVTPPAYSPPKGYDWNGAYIGLYGGHDWIDTTVTGPTPENDKAHGFSGGGYLGYNHDLGNGYLAGLEALAGLSGAKDNDGPVNVDPAWTGSLRARMGLALNNSLVYGLAGLAGTSIKATENGVSDTQTHLGWTLGGGLETFITPNVIARAEYGYSDFNNQTYSLGSGNHELDLQSHSINLGLGLKF